MHIRSNTKLFLIPFLLVIVFISCTKSHRPRTNTKLSNYSGKYIGQTEPDSVPKLFAPDFISTGYQERDAAFSPDGKEFYYTVIGKGKGIIVFVKETDEYWTKPEIVSFSGKHSDLEPFITHDGKRLYFASNRPLSMDDSTSDYNILFVERMDDGWSEPKSIGEIINTDDNEFYPSLTTDGTLYFTAQRQNTFGGEDIYRSKFIDGKFQEAENLGKSINSQGGEYNAYISPDESFLIFSTYKRDEGFGSGDLYISFRDDMDQWIPAKNLGVVVNSASIDYCPAFSPDGKYFFYSSRRSDENLGEPEELTYNKLTKFLNGPENGLGDIYWVKSDFIFELKDK